MTEATATARNARCRADVPAKPPIRNRRCTAQNRLGEPCEAPPLRESKFCIAHDPKRVAEWRNRCRRGGSIRPAPFGLRFRHSLESPATIHAALDALFRLHAKGWRRARRGHVAVNRDDVRLSLELCQTALRAWQVARAADKAGAAAPGAPEKSIDEL